MPEPNCAPDALHPERALPPPGSVLLTASLADRVRCFVIERLLRKRARALREGGMPTLACFPLDSIGREIVSDAFYERELLDALFEGALGAWRARFSSTAALDVGANVGNHSCFFSSRFAQVHAFEVNPTAALVLRANVAFNQLGNVSVHEVGLGDTAALLPFEEFRGGNIGRSRFVSAGSQSSAAESQSMLRVVRFDQLEPELGIKHEVSLVKIDVEGFERRVISGMASMLARDQPLVLFESQAAQGPEGCEAIMALLRSLGYRRFVAVERPGARGSLSRARILDAIGGRVWRLVEIEKPREGFDQLLVALP